MPDQTPEEILEKAAAHLRAACPPGVTLEVKPGHGGEPYVTDPHSPYGLRGVGEPPTISSTPAIVAAVRAATGKPLTRVPIRPEHIVGC